MTSRKYRWRPEYRSTAISLFTTNRPFCFRSLQLYIFACDISTFSSTRSIMFSAHHSPPAPSFINENKQILGTFFAYFPLRKQMFLEYITKNMHCAPRIPHMATVCCELAHTGSNSDPKSAGSLPTSSCLARIGHCPMLLSDLLAQLGDEQFKKVRHDIGKHKHHFKKSFFMQHKYGYIHS